MAVGRRRGDPPVPKVVGDWPPVAGTYKGRMTKRGPWLAIRIWYGPPLDPWDKTELDRSPRWQATLGGDLIPPDQVWPYCANHPVDGREFNYLTAVRDHALLHDPTQPEAAPDKPLDLLRLQPPVFERNNG